VARDDESVVAVPYFAPRCPHRKKLTIAKPMVLFAPPPPSADMAITAVIEFLNTPDMVVAAH
jgi:hypothetical protein